MLAKLIKLYCILGVVVNDVTFDVYAGIGVVSQFNVECKPFDEKSCIRLDKSSLDE